MESRLRLLLLMALATALATALSGCSLFGRDRAPVPESSGSAPVISPEVERRVIKEPRIDTEDFELGLYYGLISVEDFGSNPIYGARIDYHVTEGLFLQGTYARSGKVGRSSEEVLNPPIDLLNGDRTYSYYDLAVGWNLLPGEVFIGRKHAFNSALYVLAGAGNTSFGGEDLFTLTFGAGYRVLATDSIALHLDVRDHLFNNDVTGEDKTTHNIEFNLGASWFF